MVCRYDREGEPSQLAAVDIFVSTVDPLKEPPLVTANTVLSILAVDYPVDKVSCYVSDDGAAMLTFEALSETSEFARKWVPFCKKYSIEPRAPEWYFAQKIDYLKDKVHPSFVKERRAMKVVTPHCYLLFSLQGVHNIIIPLSSPYMTLLLYRRENTRSLKFVSMDLLLRHRKFLMKGGSCKMVHHGLEITLEIIQE